MDRSQINAALREHHEAFIALILAIPFEERDRSVNGKWSAAQHLDHIHRAIAPVSMALMVPKWFLRWRFGRPNRTPRDYDGLVQRYQEKLAAGGRAAGRFLPAAMPTSAVEGTAGSVRRIVKTMTRRIHNWSGAEFDSYLLPHPLLGKLTVREMLFFRIYHVQHHQALVERDHAA